MRFLYGSCTDSLFALNSSIEPGLRIVGIRTSNTSADKLCASSAQNISTPSSDFTLCASIAPLLSEVLNPLKIISEPLAYFIFLSWTIHPGSSSSVITSAKARLTESAVVFSYSRPAQIRVFFSIAVKIRAVEKFLVFPPARPDSSTI